MGPGRKMASTKWQPKGAEAALTEYEKEKAQIVLRNNQMLHRFGVSALSSIVNGMSTKRKRVMAVEDHIEPPMQTREQTKELQSTNEKHDCQTTNSEDCTFQPCDEIEICNEANDNGKAHHWNRGRSMGKKLDRISRGLNAKIPVHITGGKKRPEAPMKAAKLASEGGIILRQHIPILPHWKHYKKDESQADLKNYMGKVAGHFDIDIDNKAVIHACTDLLKGGQLQMRYRLKKLYFDGIPANEVRTTTPLATMTDEEWRALVEMWSSAKHKDKCMKNRENREKVVFQQKTGSRCFIAHCHTVKQDKYKDVESSSIDLFKECHCSSRTGFSAPMKKAIDEMEAIMAEPIEEGQEPKSATEVICQVLPRLKFLKTSGIVSSAPKIGGKAAVATRVHELELELNAEKLESTALKGKLEAQEVQLVN